MNTVLAWVAFVLGAFLCLVNFYLSFLRYPLHRLRGLQRESYRWSSGIPVFGSLFVGLSLLALHARPGILPAALVLMAIDTGGIHWFVGTMIFRSVRGEKAG